MTFSITNGEAGSVRFAVEGELDTRTVPELRKAIEGVVASNPKHVDVDLSGLRMLDSSGVGALVSLARQAPEFAHRAERLSREIDKMAEHGLRFDEDTARAIGKAEARATRWGRVALWVIALALVWIAVQLG